MALKIQLKTICSYERCVHEAEMKLNKMRQAKEIATKTAEAEKAKLKEKADNKYSEISAVETKIKECRSQREPNARDEIILSVIVLAVVIAYQLLTRFIVSGLLGITDVSTAITAMIVVYVITAIALAIVAYRVFYGGFGAFCIIAISCLVISWITGTYLHATVSEQVSVDNAIALAHIFVDVLLVVGESIYCYRGYKQSENRYNRVLQKIREYKQEIANIKKEYAKLCKDVLDYEQKAKKALAAMQLDIEKQIKSVAEYKGKLRLAYADSPLHPNYQNWVAAATIYEYLDVGRCYELKGPDGAYNLYESEVIAHKILDSLSAIKSSISYYGAAINQSQHYIRSQLAECNKNIEKVVVNTYGL